MTGTVENAEDVMEKLTSERFGGRAGLMSVVIGSDIASFLPMIASSADNRGFHRLFHEIPNRLAERGQGRKRRRRGGRKECSGKGSDVAEEEDL